MKADAQMLEMLRRKGATIGPTAGELVAKAFRDSEERNRRLNVGEPLSDIFPDAFPAKIGKKQKSMIRRMKSKTEKRFAAWLDRQQSDGLILAWRYEAVRFQLVDHDQLSRTYTPDFMAWLDGGRRRFYEVKSRFERDSDNETRAMVLWVRQQYADRNHEFLACREGEPGVFELIWQGES
jgi:hypothetical protein